MTDGGRLDRWCTAGHINGPWTPPTEIAATIGADRFLFYTRMPEAEVRREIDSMMADVEALNPGLLARISVFGTSDHGGSPHWRDPVTAGELKLAVKRILRLK